MNKQKLFTSVEEIINDVNINIVVRAYLNGVLKSGADVEFEGKHSFHSSYIFRFKTLQDKIIFQLSLQEEDSSFIRLQKYDMVGVNGAAYVLSPKGTYSLSRVLYMFDDELKFWIEIF